MARGAVTKRITIVSFNENERAAVDELLDDLAASPSPWNRVQGGIRLRAVSEDFHVTHIPTQAQGNVVAAAQLASEFGQGTRAPEYVVFYGCAGAILPKHVGMGFLVERADYLSLGTVDRARHREVVTVKSKWLVELDPPEPNTRPLPSVVFPLVTSGGAGLDLQKLSQIPAAHVVATDKVIKITPGTPPNPVVTTPSSRYAKEEWPYATALGLWAGTRRGAPPILIEMESYGVGLVARALNLLERVVVLRVVTDALDDHSVSDDAQRELLREGRLMLGHVLAVLFNPADFQP